MRPSPKPKVECPGCDRLRVHWCRGLCQRCYQDPAARAARPYERSRRPVPTAECNRLVTDAAVTPPPYLRTLARDVSRHFGAKVDPEDLVQEAYLVLLRSAAAWLRKGLRQKDFNLARYARKGVKAAMWRYARAEQLSGMGGGLADLFNPVSPSSLAGGLDTVLSKFSPEVVAKVAPVEVSPHALTRYRQRVNPTGTRQDIRNRLRRAVPVPYWLRRYLEDKPLQNGDLFLAHEGFLYTLHSWQPSRWGYGPVLLTIVPVRNVIRGATLRGYADRYGGVP